MMLLKQTVIRGKDSKILFNVQLLPPRDGTGKAFPEFLPPFAAILTGKIKKIADNPGGVSALYADLWSSYFRASFTASLGTISSLKTYAPVLGERTILITLL